MIIKIPDWQNIVTWLNFLHPKWWLSNEPTNDDWDRILNGYLDNQYLQIDTTDNFHYTVKLTVGKDSVTIWISNYPYCYGYDYGNRVRVLPKKRTRLKLHNMLKEHVNSEEARRLVALYGEERVGGTQELVDNLIKDMEGKKS